MGIFLSVASMENGALAVEANSNTTDQIKNELLADPNFIAALADAVKKQTSDDHIREVVKDYLVKNPEVMIEVQEALNNKIEQKNTENRSSTITGMKDEIFNSSDDGILGNPNGKISLVEFFDYNCGYCKKSYPDIQALIKGDPDLRIVLKDFPVLGDDSVKAHIVARAFMKLMPMKFAAFHNQMMTSEGRANEEKAIKIAVKLGIDEKQLRQTMKDPDIQQVFMKNGKLAYLLDINGTPSYILGNEVLVGAVGENILKKKITLLEQ
ncbi:DsbA family protein [Bartonella apihabitans]|uniref:DsbA family protein n=1 Tax=uncultured Bartonella sp. TaxID=104108 RepID=UPI00260096A9|nr:DsbA family protein [Bartonella apihabitans]WLT09599.1 DsbA family protein [Bartonella apihabitans]